MSDKRTARKSRWIWLSHILTCDTPAYANGRSFEIVSEKEISAGDSCNTLRFTMSNHLGSHVDAPLHFILGGLSVECFSPEEWMFHNPLLVDIAVDSDLLVTNHLLDQCLASGSLTNDLLLLRTGFERFRQQERFWKAGPGLAQELGPYLQEKFPNLRAIGVDCISIASLQHREAGRNAHRTLLGSGLRLFEDLALALIPANELEQVIALPLRFSAADGAPCTIIAELKATASG